MSAQRIHVWVQEFKDRKSLMLQWIDPDTGKRKSKSAETSDPDQAEIARADHEADLNAGRYLDVGRMSWERFRELFEQEYVSSLRRNTRLNYDKALDLFEHHCQPRRLDRITVRTISAFATALRSSGGRKKGEGMMPSTIKVRLEFLHTALSWAVKQKLLAEVPAFPRVDVPERAPQPVPTEAFELLLDKSEDQQMKAFLLCGWLAGLRLTEAYELEWELSDTAPWVDLSRDRIWLPAALVKGKRDQWLPLDPILREALEALPRHGRKVFRFIGRKGLITVGGLSQNICLLARRAGVRLTMRSLRRGFGCRYAGKVPAQVLQKLMRHRNIKTTMDFYANVDDAVEEAVLGPKCNRKRNTPAEATPRNDSPNAVNPSTSSPS
jgi:integrase